MLETIHVLGLLHSYLLQRVIKTRLYEEEIWMLDN